MGSSKAQRKKLLWAAIGLAVLMVLAVGSQGAFQRLDILPGFEGMQNGIYGYQPNTEMTSPLNSPLVAAPGTCSYNWITSTYQSGGVTVKVPSYISGILTQCLITAVPDTLIFEAQQNVIPYTEQYSTPLQVNYYVPIPGSGTGASEQWQYVTGQVEEYTYNINLVIQGGSGGNYGFQGDTVWFNLLSLVWNNAAPTLQAGADSVPGQVFETPLYGVVTQVQWTYGPGTNQCSLCAVGEAVPFYSSATTSGPCNTLAGLVTCQSPPSNLNNSLSSTYAPDTRMQKLVYYPVVVQKFQNSCNPLLPAGNSCNAPSATITIKLYTLRLGEYILTNPDKTALQGQKGSCSELACLTDDLAGFFANPFGSVFGTIFIVVIVLLALGYAAPSLSLFARRKS